MGTGEPHGEAESWLLALRAMTRIAAVGVGTGDADGSEIAAPRWPELLPAARYHGLIGELGRGASLLGWAIPPDVREILNLRTMRSMRLLSTTRAVMDALARAGIDALTFKGLALAAETRPDPLLRSSADIDILIRPETLREAVAALRGIGATVVPGYPEPDDSKPFLLFRRLRHELTLSLHDVHVDVHWRLGLDRSLLPSAGEALARARYVTVADTQLRTLHPRDALTHSYLHWNSDKHPRLKNALDIAILAGRTDSRASESDPRRSRAVAELTRIAQALVEGDFRGAAGAARSGRGRRLVRRTLAVPREMPVAEERVRSFAHHLTAPRSWRDRAAHPARLGSRLFLEGYRRFRPTEPPPVAPGRDSR